MTSRFSETANRRDVLKYLAASSALAYGMTNSGFAAAAANPSLKDEIRAWADAKDVTPEMHQVREYLYPHFMALASSKSLARDRQILETTFSSHVKLPSDIHFTEVNTDGVKGEWSEGKTTLKGKVLYYLHGGGYSMGSVEAWRAVSAVVGDTAHLRTFSLNYRLAPEHPYPAGLNDAVAGYKWLLSQGYHASDIIISGDSAGGGLALATVLKLKALKIDLPAGIYLLSPWTDMTLTSHTMNHPPEFDPFNRKADNASNRQLYIGDHSPKDPYISPLFGDFTGFPPVLTQVGGNEAYLDDSLNLAKRAISQGVQVDVETWPHVFHVWQGWAPYLPAAREALKAGAEFMQACLSQAK